MARAQGARAQMALASETPYGTPPVGGFTQMPFASTSLGAEQPFLNSKLLGYGHDPLAPIKDAATSDGDVVVPLDAEIYGFWLKAAFEAPTKCGPEALYSHDFQSGSWTLPGMTWRARAPGRETHSWRRALVPSSGRLCAAVDTRMKGVLREPRAARASNLPGPGAKMAIFRTVFLVAAVAVTGACLAPQTIGTQEFAGTEWRLVEMDDIPVVTAAERPFVLAFGRDGKVSGQACNHLGGDYRLQGQRIAFGPVAMTEMSCGEAMDRLEGRFLQILSEPLAYQFVPEGGLLLGDPGRPALRLLPRAGIGSRIVTGQWGGSHVGLVLEAAGGSLEYDCASGRIEGPISIDRYGRFSALGYHMPGEGGPERQGQVSPRLAAVYSGRVSGGAMTLLVRVPSANLEIGPLSLLRNAEPNILRCL